MTLTLGQIAIFALVAAGIMALVFAGRVSADAALVLLGNIIGYVAGDRAADKRTERAIEVAEAKAKK